MKRIRFILALIAFLLVLPQRSSAQETAQTSALEAYTIEPDSRLAIEGTSTVDSFVCEAPMDAVTHRNQSDDGADGRPVDIVSDGDGIALNVPVKSFDCGKARMNRDMYEALKASAYPTISFRVDNVKTAAAADGVGDETWLTVEGWLSLAGTERSVAVRAQASDLSDGRVRAHGGVNLLMTDFGINPPTALLGLVRAHDKITVTFDLIGSRRNASHASR